jgi:hypothetical protein
MNVPARPPTHFVRTGDLADRVEGRRRPGRSKLRAATSGARGLPSAGTPSGLPHWQRVSAVWLGPLSVRAAAGTGLPEFPPTSAPGTQLGPVQFWAHPSPRLPRDSARPRPVLGSPLPTSALGTQLGPVRHSAAVSAHSRETCPAIGLTPGPCHVPYWAHPRPHLRRDCSHSGPRPSERLAWWSFCARGPPGACGLLPRADAARLRRAGRVGMTQPWRCKWGQSSNEPEGRLAAVTA